MSKTEYLKEYTVCVLAVYGHLIQQQKQAVNTTLTYYIS